MRPFGIVSEIRNMVGAGDGQKARAWALAWRAVRFLERAEETARRNRIAGFDPRGEAPIGDPVRFIAARCIAAAVPAPTLTEAATCAALADAVSLARTVADILFRDYCASTPQVDPAKLKDAKRLALLRAARSIAVIRAEGYLAEHAGDEEQERAANAEHARLRRAAHEARILAEREARILANKARRLAHKGSA